MQFLHYRRLVPAPPREQPSPRHSKHNEERLTVRLPPLAEATLPAPVQPIAQPAAQVPVRLAPVRVPTAQLATLPVEDSRASPISTATVRLRERVRRQPVPNRADGYVLPVLIRDANVR